MPADARLYLNPIQTIPSAKGVVVRRGTVRLEVSGDRAAEVVQNIIQATSRPNGSTRQEILALFDIELREAVGELIDTLASRRLLVTLSKEEDLDLSVERRRTEDYQDIFCWIFDADSKEVTRTVSSTSVAIVGVNSISRAFSNGLREAGFRAVSIVDHPLLRAVRFFDSSGDIDDGAWGCERPIPYEKWSGSEGHPDCLVVTSDFGGLSLMREWNEYCVRFGILFYPVVLQDMVGFSGPLVIPGQTACFECFWARQNSNLDTDAWAREAETVAFQGQIIDGHHSAMVATLAHASAFELFRYYGKIPGFREGSVLELDLISSSMTARKILRVPRCPVCGSVRTHAKIAIERNTSMPGNPFEG